MVVDIDEETNIDFANSEMYYMRFLLANWRRRTKRSWNLKQNSQNPDVNYHLQTDSVWLDWYDEHMKVWDTLTEIAS
jgi:hypothetical protein